MLSDDVALDDDPGRIDRELLVRILGSEVYWGRWRTAQDINRQWDEAWRVVGAYQCDSGRMVGFARAASDGSAIAYLADVYVDPAMRGRGIGEALIRAMIDDGPGADFRWMLHTDDAHGLYRKFGFDRPDRTYLERPAGPAKRRLIT
ncbi:MAG TPA: GNAT family N-acetyltransferase [Micromonosporaceae bacterium]|jgi:GNAT superfamily N-acetyltransferase